MFKYGLSLTGKSKKPTSPEDGEATVRVSDTGRSVVHEKLKRRAQPSAEENAAEAARVQLLQKRLLVHPCPPHFSVADAAAAPSWSEYPPLREFVLGHAYLPDTRIGDDPAEGVLAARPLVPQDMAGMRRASALLSERSLLLRFMRSVSHIDRGLAKALTHLNPSRHFALVVFLLPRRGQEGTFAVGMRRWMRGRTIDPDLRAGATWETVRPDGEEDAVGEDVVEGDGAAGQGLEGADPAQAAREGAGASRGAEESEPAPAPAAEAEAAEEEAAAAEDAGSSGEGPPQRRRRHPLPADGEVVWGERVGVPVAVGRIARQADDPTEAEVAMTVVDAYQHRGVGRELALRVAEVAAGLGVKTIVCHSHPDNHVVHAALETVSGTSRRRRLGDLEAVVYHLEAPLRPHETAATAKRHSSFSAESNAFARRAMALPGGVLSTHGAAEGGAGGSEGAAGGTRTQ